MTSFKLSPYNSYEYDSRLLFDKGHSFLTFSILADIKKENNALQTKATEAEKANKQLKKDNEVLLREVERMKYLLNIQD